MTLLLTVLYLALPAFVANMMPVFAARLGILGSFNTPIDGGREWRGKRLLGDNKTWRGVVAAVVGAAATAAAQYFVGVSLPLETVVYSSLGTALIYGAYVGVLAMLGDAIGSVIKRQLGFASGAPCIPLDQLDYILAFIAGTFIFTHWTLAAVGVLVFFTFFANLLANALGYVIGIKNTYW